MLLVWVCPQKKRVVRVSRETGEKKKEEGGTGDGGREKWKRKKKRDYQSLRKNIEKNVAGIHVQNYELWEEFCLN